VLDALHRAWPRPSRRQKKGATGCPGRPLDID
jgi:hypothetical protein